MTNIKLKLWPVLCCLSILWMAAGCSTPQQTRVEKENTNGIKPDEIVIGSSLALAGHAGYLGTQMLQGAMAYINQVNESGGIHGRKITLKVLDDSYNPTLCLYNTQKLILEKQVFSLFCYVGTPTTVRIIPLVNEAKIPLVGMFTGAHSLRKPVNRYLINIRASYYQETRAAVRLIVNEKKLKRIAVFYQYDEYGFEGLRGTEIALKEYGMVPVAKGSYIRGTLDVENGLEKIIRSGAEAVVMIGTYDSCAKFISLARSRGFNPLFHNVSFVGSTELARRLGPAGNGVIVTQVMPSPHTTELSGVEDYKRLLELYYPESRPSFVGLEGYINARVLVEGLTRAGKDITREKFIRAIESISDFDLGIGHLLTFGPGDYQGLDSVYYTRIENGELIQVK